jgi:hypothetical protein
VSDPLVWSFGGGVQSVAIGALVGLGRLPMPDLIVIADTGREVETTWATCEAMRERGFRVEVASHDLATVDLYRDDTLLIPAHTRTGRLPGYCSNEWKQRVVRRWLRQRGVLDCDLWLGISMDEAHRMKPSGAEWLRHAYPLIDLRVTRAECHRLIAEAGWPQPDKSRCWACPYQSRSEWLSLTSADRARAEALDVQIRARDPDVFLHRFGLPLAEALAREDEQAQLFDGCDSGHCWT